MSQRKAAGTRSDSAGRAGSRHGGLYGNLPLGVGRLPDTTGKRETERPKPYTISYEPSAKDMIDTLPSADDLSVAGIEREHAKAQAKAIAKAVEQQHGEAASKADVSALKWIAGVHMAITLALFAVVLAS